VARGKEGTVNRGGRQVNAENERRMHGCPVKCKTDTDKKTGPGTTRGRRREERGTSFLQKVLTEKKKTSSKRKGIIVGVIQEKSTEKKKIRERVR